MSHESHGAAGNKPQFVFALAVGAALALISWQLGVLDGSTDIFGRFKISNQGITSCCLNSYKLW